jgi:etoposide-induced 2.4 mRNA
MHARPVPHDPYNPIPPAEDTIVRHPSPFIPIRLPIFVIVIWLNEWLVWILSVGGPREIASPTHRRRISEAVESVEEGEVVELRPVQGTWRETRFSGVSKRVHTR